MWRRISPRNPLLAFLPGDLVTLRRGRADPLKVLKGELRIDGYETLADVQRRVDSFPTIELVLQLEEGLGQYLRQ